VPETENVPSTLRFPVAGIQTIVAPNGQTYVRLSALLMYLEDSGFDTEALSHAGCPRCYGTGEVADPELRAATQGHDLTPMPCPERRDA